MKLSPPPIKPPPPPPPLPSLVSLILPKERIPPPPPLSLCLSSPPPPPLLLPPLVQPPGQAFGPLEATWPLCSWHHSVWRVRTPACSKGLMMSYQLVRPQGCYTMACNNMADHNPLRAAPVQIGSHPYGETKELLLDVFAAVTYGRHVHCTWELVQAWFKLKIDPESGWASMWLGPLWLAVWIDQESDWPSS